MERVRLWPKRERAAHYQSQADRLHRMAEAETIEAIRNELLAVAHQYQELADSYKPDKSGS